MFITRIADYCFHPDKIVIALGSRGLLPFMSDQAYIRTFFRSRIGYDPDLDHPETFNEKLQWLKLHDKNPEYVTMVDKSEAKKYVAGKIGAEYIIPTLGVWNSFDDISVEKLPKQFVLKCTHDSGGVEIVKNKELFDRRAARAKLQGRLRKNYFWVGREWPYKQIRPRIIAEQYISDDLGKNELTDYKLMCFGGKVLCAFTCTDRFSKEGLKVTFFDRNWNVLPFIRHYPKSNHPIPAPRNLEKMIDLAEILSKHIPFVRVDFYEQGDQIFFGELTFYPGSGFEEFMPFEWDKTLGSWIDLRLVNN